MASRLHTDATTSVDWLHQHRKANATSLRQGLRYFTGDDRRALRHPHAVFGHEFARASLVGHCFKSLWASANEHRA